MINNNITSKEFCYQSLKRVSRSFYLNTVALRDPLKDYVCVAYLLCRIADTIEDDPKLSAKTKREGFIIFETALEGKPPTAEWIEFVSLLNCNPHEKLLAENYHQVLDILSNFQENIRKILIRKILIMTTGMAQYVQKFENQKEFFENFNQLDDYCYYVAGVVGELLTELFSEEMNINNTSMTKLNQNSISFGLALQYTNIIKDYTTDGDRGVSFWPTSVQNKNSTNNDPLREMSLRCLDHMVNSFEYIENLPKKEKTIRIFCLWPLFFAMATLEEINKDHKRFKDNKNIKISRGRIKFIMLITSVFYRSNFILRIYFNLYFSSIKKRLAA